MKLEDQVVSLELAKRLKELGVKQESLWYWAEGDMGGMSVETEGRNLWKKDWRFQFSAFTVAELGEMLGQFWSGKQGDSFQCKRWVHERDEATQTSDTEADARAKMLIYLIENGLLKEKGS